MGQAGRTTKLLLDLDDRAQGGANTVKRAYLQETAKLLDRARAFYVAFFLAHPDKQAELVTYCSERLQEERERLISPNELLTWAESLTVATAAHPHPLPSYNFSEQFPEFPFIYRRSVIKDAIGKVRSFLSHLTSWNASRKKQGQPGSPGASNHPTLYDEAFCLDLDGTDLHPSPRTCFARLKVYTGTAWQSGKPVKGEQSNQQVWAHFRRMNRRQANQLRGKINRYAKDKAYESGTVTVEVNPHGTSQYCSRCGAKGERFSYRGGKRITEKWGKLFACPICHYEANADFNASVNVHHSFYREWH
jgi:hypothetical protein